MQIKKMEGIMAHSYISIYVHCVFSTKYRQKLITPELQTRLWQYIGALARENKMKALAVGGVEDHVHLLLSLPPTLSISKAIQLIKGNSSRWVSDTFSEYRHFKWQEGYGAFSVSLSGIKRTIGYIRIQRQHHSKSIFQTEYISFLQKHDIDYDERYLWG